MFRVTITHEGKTTKLPEFYTTAHRGGIAGMEHLTIVLRENPAYARMMFRMEGRVRWTYAQRFITVERAVNEWLELDVENLPEHDTDDCSVVFILRGSERRYLGHYDAGTESFVCGTTDKVFKPKRVLAFMLLSDDVGEATDGTKKSRARDDDADGDDDDDEVEADEDEHEPPPAGTFANFED